jgi:hypothetical protein
MAAVKDDRGRASFSQQNDKVDASALEGYLLTTASASSDRNDEIGFGVINTVDTYHCLVNTDGCAAPM